MKKTLLLIFILCIQLSFSADIPYPFIYIPGMFDNGDLCTSDYLLVKNLNNEDGYYYKNYFTIENSYNKETLQCSSNIVGSKYNRLIVANLIGTYRTNISIWLMADRFFALMQGKAPKGKNYWGLTNYKGNNFTGAIVRDGKNITYQGIIQEVWAKYGKKVYYKANKDENAVCFDINGSTGYYENKDGYFDSPTDIKFNFVVHSSGGIALRRYIQMCTEEKLPVNVNVIINLSVPQQGARMMYKLKSAFPELIENAINTFWANVDSGKVTIKNGTNEKIYSYKDITDLTRVELMHGDNLAAKLVRKIIGDYILYFIKFDGVKRVLGTDPALYDLHPDHKLIQTLNHAVIPKDIKIYNYRVLSPYAGMFKNIGKFLDLDKNDGVVDYRDTDIRFIPNGDKLNITDIDVAKANHIPFPYIKPVFELRETMNEYYGFLSILLKQKVDKEDGLSILQAMMLAIMHEIGLDLDKVLKSENYSVIDYFAENPVKF